MKRASLLWISTVPLAGFWLFSLGLYNQNIIKETAAIYVAIGIAIATIALWKQDFKTEGQYILLAIPMAISSLIIPFPYKIGPLLLTIGILWTNIPSQNALFKGFIACGLLLILQNIILIFYFIFIPIHHNAYFPSIVLYMLMKLTGLNASLYHNQIFISVDYNTYVLPTTWDKLGINIFLLILAPIVSLAVTSAQTWLMRLKIGMVSILCGLIYVIVRYLTIVHIFFSQRPVNIALIRVMFTDPTWLLMSFIPLAIIFIALIQLDLKSISLKVRGDMRSIITYFIIFISVFLVTSSIMFQVDGTQKGGRILIDERNNMWETSTLKLDKSWYGEASTYNSYSMVEWLKGFYHVDRLMQTGYENWNATPASKVKADIISDHISQSILNNYDILIIKMPKPYASQEIAAIENFVKCGGGLLLIGDHSNFCGTSTALNDVANKFGIHFESDTVNSGTINTLSTYFRENNMLFGKLGFSHPCLKYMPYFEFMTSCSLTGSPFSEQIIKGNYLAVEPGEFSTPGFFRQSRLYDPSRAWETNWGPYNQAIAAKYGDGRVVAFTDSTTISNFRIFFGGSPNFLIGTMEYLNCRNTSPGTKVFLFIFGAFLALVAAYLYRINKKTNEVLSVIAIGSLAISVALVLFSSPIEESVPAIYYNNDYTICFDSEHSSPIVDTSSMMGTSNISNNYNTFFVWTQRANLTPFIGNLEDCLERGNTIVIIDPIRELNPQENESLKAFMESGGRTLILINQSDTPIRPFINQFHMDLKDIIQGDIYHNFTDATSNYTNILPIKPWGTSIIGGVPIKKIGNRTILAKSPYFEGYLVLFTQSCVFRDGINGSPGYMGNVSTSPEEQNIPYDLKRLYKLEYDLISGC